MFGYFDLYFLLFITIRNDMKTAQKIVNNSMKENRLPLKASSLRYYRRYVGITHLCENAHFTFKILQYICFICTCYICSYDKCVWDMSQCKKLSNIQCAIFQILHVDLHFGLFWWAGISTMTVKLCCSHTIWIRPWSFRY